MNDDLPLVTFAIFAYNQEKYIREAVQGALAQDYRPLEIIVSDDCSSDRTHAIAQEAAREVSPGLPVRVLRNEENLGLIQHFQKVAALASGEILVVAAGDDISLPDRTSKSVAALLADPGVKTLSMGVQTISPDGQLVGSMKKTFPSGTYSWDRYRRGKPVPILGASRAYRKELLVDPGMSPALLSEDNILVARALLLDGRITHLADIGVMYRISGNTQSSRLNTRAGIFAFRQKMRDLRHFTSKGVIEPGLVASAAGLYRRQLKGSLAFASALAGPPLRGLAIGMCNPGFSLAQRTALIREIAVKQVRSVMGRGVA